MTTDNKTKPLLMALQSHSAQIASEFWTCIILVFEREISRYTLFQEIHFYVCNK